MKVLKKYIPILLIVILFQNCFTVDSFGEFWSKAIIDKELVGTWMNKDKETVIFAKKGSTVELYDAKSSEKYRIRTLLYKNHRIALSDRLDESGYGSKGRKYIMMYEIKNKKLITYATTDESNKILQDKLGKKMINVTKFEIHAKELNDVILTALISLPKDKTHFHIDDSLMKN